MVGMALILLLAELPLVEGCFMLIGRNDLLVSE